MPKAKPWRLREVKASAPAEAKAEASRKSRQVRGYCRAHSDYEDRIVQRLRKFVTRTGWRPAPRQSCSKGVVSAQTRRSRDRGRAIELIAGPKRLSQGQASIAQFNLREGCRSLQVLLSRRGTILDRLVTVLASRARFPRLNPNLRQPWPLRHGPQGTDIFPGSIDRHRWGMDVIITTTAKTDEEARELLRLFNFPFPADEQKEAA